MSATPEQDTLYGLEDQEQLDLDPDDTVERILDEAVEKRGETFNEVAARLEWPINVLVYRRATIPASRRKALSEFAVAELLYRLDEDFGDPDGDHHSEPTPEMLDAARIFVNQLCDQYKPWLCEPSGQVEVYDQAMARAMWDEMGE
jgi:hypothetical protein